MESFVVKYQRWAEEWLRLQSTACADESVESLIDPLHQVSCGVVLVAQVEQEANAL